MIKVTNLNKYYNKGKENEIHVINNASLSLPSTGIVSFLGQSGSGKTTLLNVIGGLDKGTGEIEYDELKVKNYKMKQIDKFRRKEIGYVFQNYNLLLEETVYDNLVLALEMIDIYDKEEQEKRIEYVLKAVGMYKYRKKKAYALSGGQQQRVSIARALVKESKIIIADEPTGNLDSENTLQVMNILKKISKTTLVLMVTHNEEIANFYSDIVYRIKDGAIIDNYEVTDAKTLDQRKANVVYLKDLNEQEDESKLATIKYYSESENPEKLDLEIIEHNGSFYIKSNKNIKLFETSNLKLVNEHYEELKKEDVDTFEYDNSFFSNGKGKRHIGSELKLYMKQSYHGISTMKKKTKFLYFSFFIIGILFAIAVCAFSNFTIVNKKVFEIDDNYYTISSGDYYSSTEETEELTKVLSQSLISNVNRIFYLDAKYEKTINYSERISVEATFPVISTLNKEYKIVKGALPNGNEIMLSKGLANKFVDASKGYFKDIDELIGVEIKLEKQTTNKESKVVISGINDNPYLMSYLPDKLYVSNIDDMIISGGNGYLMRDYEIEKANNTYEIVKGRDLNITDAGHQTILIPDTYEDSLNQIDQEISIDGTIYKIVGVYKMKGITNYNNEYITNSGAGLYPDDSTRTYGVVDYAEYTIVSGKNPLGNYEAIVPLYSNLNIGDKSGIFTIVGKYSSPKEYMDYILIPRDSYVLGHEIYSKCVFDVKNMNDLNTGLKNKYTIKTTYDDIYDYTRADQNISLAIFGSFALILIIILVIFIYFLMRSRMISEIYPIGVYRSLGASKGRIYNKFICDIFVTTSLTAVIGYAIFMVLYGTIANTANSLLGGITLVNSIPMTLIGILGLYLISFIFGLIPIQSLMRKTPAEILSKYDI